MAAFDIYGKVRAKQRAQSAVRAKGITLDFRGVVAFGVGAFGHHQYAAGAEFNTEPATFASLIDDMDDAAGNLVAILIKWLSPIHEGLFFGAGLWFGARMREQKKRK